MRSFFFFCPSVAKGLFKCNSTKQTLKRDQPPTRTVGCILFIVILILIPSWTLRLPSQAHCPSFQNSFSLFFFHYPVENMNYTAMRYINSKKWHISLKNKFKIVSYFSRWLSESIPSITISGNCGINVVHALIGRRTKRYSKTDNSTSSKLANHRALFNSLATLRGNKPTHIRKKRNKVKSDDSPFPVMVSSVYSPPLVNHSSLCLCFFNYYSLIPLHAIKGRKSSEKLSTVKYQIK